MDDAFFESVNGRLSREAGVPTLIGNGTGGECAMFLCETYDLLNTAHDTADVFVKLCMSFIELVFREGERLAAAVVSGPAAWPKGERTPKTSRGQQAFNEGYEPIVKRMVDELNIRLRDSGTGMHYHNGLIQVAHDTMTQSQIASPFWDVVKDPKWTNVDRDMKEAIDRRDTGGRDPAGYALRALESILKVISAQKGWTTGKETGASGFIDHLQSAKNGNFIDGWEADALRQMFRHIRNPVVAYEVHRLGSISFCSRRPDLKPVSHMGLWVWVH